MANFFPRQTLEFKFEEPKAFRRISFSLIEMAVITGILGGRNPFGRSGRVSFSLRSNFTAPACNLRHHRSQSRRGGSL